MRWLNIVQSFFGTSAIKSRLDFDGIFLLGQAQAARLCQAYGECPP